MTIEGIVDYIFFNPVVVNSASTLKNIGGGLVNTVMWKKEPKEIIKIMEPLPLWKLAGSSNIFIKIAALSGATAVMLGAYGAHKIHSDKDLDENLKKGFETANKYHFIHSLALLSVPLCKYPALSGSLFTLGITLFCGSCYYAAISNDFRFRKITPVGGTCFILGWLALAL